MSLQLISTINDDELAVLKQYTPRGWWDILRMWHYRKMWGGKIRVYKNGYDHTLTTKCRIAN